jgi:hypothetical protein
MRRQRLAGQDGLAGMLLINILAIPAAVLWCALLYFLYHLYRSFTFRGIAAYELRQWAAEEGIEIVALRPCGRPPDSVAEQFPHLPGGLVEWLQMPFRYFEITTIDADHVRRSGVARVRSEIHNRERDLDRRVDYVRLTSEQLNWLDRPPRRPSPPDRAEGWYADDTGAHELRWYSAGTPTDLVKDGATESRDPPGCN